MIHKGQMYRKSGANDVWEVIGQRQNLLGRTPEAYKDQWLLLNQGGGEVESINVCDLENGTDWIIVPKT